MSEEALKKIEYLAQTKELIKEALREQGSDITDEEFEDALDTLVTHMMQHQLHSINLDLDIRDKILEDRNKPMEVTLEELKHFFGRDVVIVQRKEEENGEQQSTN